MFLVFFFSILLFFGFSLFLLFFIISQFLLIFLIFLNLSCNFSWFLVIFVIFVIVVIVVKFSSEVSSFGSMVWGSKLLPHCSERSTWLGNPRSGTWRFFARTSGIYGADVRDPKGPQDPKSLAWYAVHCRSGACLWNPLPAYGFLICNPPLGPFGPEVSRECPSRCLWGPSGPGLRSVQRGSRECPRSVKKVSRHSRDTLETLFGHSGAQGPKGPIDTLKDTPGTLRARRAREAPVAGRGGCNSWLLCHAFI